MPVDVRTNGSSFGTFVHVILSQVDKYSPMAVSKSKNVKKKSLPHVIPPYRCDETDAACLHRIEKQDMRACYRMVRPDKRYGSRMRRHIVNKLLEPYVAYGHKIP